jgi:hypothetical protein
LVICVVGWKGKGVKLNADCLKALAKPVTMERQAHARLGVGFSAVRDRNFPDFQTTAAEATQNLFVQFFSFLGFLSKSGLHPCSIRGKHEKPQRLREGPSAALVAAALAPMLRGHPGRNLGHPPSPRLRWTG